LGYGAHGEGKEDSMDELLWFDDRNGVPR